MRAESFKDDVRRAFTAYVQHAAEVINQWRTPKKRHLNDTHNVAYLAPAFALRSLVEKAESSTQFDDLTHAISRAFRQSLHWTYPFREAVCCFFRRSHFYLNVSTSKRWVTDELFDYFWSLWFHRKRKITSLRVLDGLSFSSRRIDLGLFRIQKFTIAELNKLTENEVNEVFYPNARFDTRLTEYWLLVEESSAELSLPENVAETDAIELAEAEYNTIDWNAVQDRIAVQRQVPDRAIQVLALHEWTPDLTEKECEEAGVTLAARGESRE